MEWDMQVVTGSSLLSPAGLGLEEMPSNPRLLWWLKPERCSMFQYAQYHAVLPDSVHLPWDLLRAFGAKSFSRVTIISCEISIGFHLYSAYAALTASRGHVCLSSDRMVCFLLKAKAIVDAPEMDIHNTSPPEMVANRKEKMMLVHTHLNLLLKILKEVTLDQFKPKD
ncbi:hypothetical protein JEQ12_018733 [Ovis aries]|uniref:Uncharacterized protein n=1 Tax=Ovis aries TaxID=9940 RepID=A0A836D0R8_SHEEP|nr:hypothetical protein JEQ12_018733 [Ovis aries]